MIPPLDARRRYGTPYPMAALLDRVVPDTDAAIPSRREAVSAAEHGGLRSRQTIRRAEIFRQTRILIGQEGYAAFTIRKIAQCCDVTPQTIYNLVGDREHLLEAAIGQHVNAMIAAARELDGPPGFFMAFADVLWGHALKNPGYVRTVSRAQFASRCIPARKVQAILTGAFSSELAKLSERGDLREGIDVAFVAEHMQSLIFMTALTWVEGGGPDGALRRQLATGLGLLLLGAMKASARGPIEAWTDAIQAQEHVIRRPPRATAGLLATNEASDALLPAT